MKKLKLFSVAFIAMFVAVLSVNAATTAAKDDLTLDARAISSKLSLSNEDMIDENTYHVHAVVTVDQATIDTVLAQKPGNSGTYGEASLGIYYFGITPKTDAFKYGSNVKHNFVSVPLGTSLADAKAQADKKNADQEGNDSGLQINDIALRIKFSKDGGKTWTNLTATGKGNTTIKSALATATGKAEADLKYGEDYIFSISEDSYTVWSWTYTNTDSKQETRYVKITYEAKFPVTASNGKDAYYYLTLEDALEATEDLGIEDITLNAGDTTIAEDITIPAGVSINVKEGAKLSFGGNVTFANGASVTGTSTNVTYAPGKTVKYAVTVEESENGSVEVDKTTAEAEDTVTITVTPKEGYKLEKLTVLDNEGKEVTVTDGKFEMPESSVTVVANFVAIVENATNPQTGDSILTYLFVGLISVIALGLGVKKLSKNN